MELHLTAAECHHMGSDSVTCHPTQVNKPRLNPCSQTGRYSSYRFNVLSHQS